MNSSELETILSQAKRKVRHKELPEAIDLFRQAVEINADSVAAHDGLAAACFMSGDDAGAIEHFTHVTRLNPTDAKAWINLGAVYNRVGQYQSAIDTLRKAVQRDSRNAQAYYNLGIAHKRFNQHRLAITAYQQAIRLDPRFAEAHQNLGNVYRDMGNNRQAITHYQKALEINPELDRARNGLASAQNADAQSSATMSPFGRLVDQPSTRGKSGVAVIRELTDEERMQDRQALSTHRRNIDIAARALLTQIRGELSPKLLSLDRAIAQMAVSPGGVMTAHDEFQDALSRFVDLRKTLKRRMIEMRGHEELINTPELNETDLL